jgi:CUE domain
LYNFNLHEDLDKEVVEDIIIAKEGRIGVCIDICLEMSGGMQPSDHSEGVGNNAKAESGQDKGKSTQQTSDLLGLENDGGFSSLNLGSDGSRSDTHGDQINLMD